MLRIFPVLILLAVTLTACSDDVTGVEPHGTYTATVTGAITAAFEYAGDALLGGSEEGTDTLTVEGTFDADPGAGPVSATGLISPLL